MLHEEDALVEKMSPYGKPPEPLPRWRRVLSSSLAKATNLAMTSLSLVTSAVVSLYRRGALTQHPAVQYGHQRQREAAQFPPAKRPAPARSAGVPPLDIAAIPLDRSWFAEWSDPKEDEPHCRHAGDAFEPLPETTTN